MSEDLPEGVVRFESKEAREERNNATYKDEVQTEAIRMLERATELVKGKRVSGLAICFTFEDGCYGRMLPTQTSDLAGLIGSIATAQQDLVLSSLAPGDWTSER